MSNLVKIGLFYFIFSFCGSVFADPVNVTIQDGDGRSDVTLQNTTNQLLLVTLNITNCRNVMNSSCGTVVGNMSMRPGQTWTKTILPSDSSRPFSYNTYVNWAPPGR